MHVCVLHAAQSALVGVLCRLQLAFGSSQLVCSCVGSAHACCALHDLGDPLTPCTICVAYCLWSVCLSAGVCIDTPNPSMDSLSAGSYVWKMSTLWHAVMHPTAYGTAQQRTALPKSLRLCVSLFACL